MAGDEPIQAAPDFPSALALGCPAFDVRARFGIVEHADPCDDVEGPVQLTVTAAVEPVPRRIARRGRDRFHPGKCSESRLGPYPAAVGARGKDDGSGDRANAVNVL
jgi:hypothetical protein